MRVERELQNVKSTLLLEQKNKEVSCNSLNHNLLSELSFNATICALFVLAVYGGISKTEVTFDDDARSECSSGVQLECGDALEA